MRELIGKAVIIRTVTYHYTGLVEEVTAEALVLSTAAWIADSGRWADALVGGTLDEIEPYPADQHVWVAKGAIVDVTIWPHSLPTKQR